MYLQDSRHFIRHSNVNVLKFQAKHATMVSFNPLCTNGFDAINLGCSTVYRGNTGYNFQIKLHFSLRIFFALGKKKNMCVYYLIKISNRIGRSIFFLIFILSFI